MRPLDGGCGSSAEDRADPAGIAVDRVVIVVVNVQCGASIRSRIDDFLGNRCQLLGAAAREIDGFDVREADEAFPGQVQMRVVADDVYRVSTFAAVELGAEGRTQKVA